ncbi:receptor-like serine/threonine-protein kinase SD1-8 [Iris pallida]|uniref:Receptor-like serine/threonine-protein kinase SD1-8 n=1 Tax=Iris pallida TaxID=29817 RepID=A0AAX6G961_IRIPA|nr:receptor-like serine/threonine-protein kinase SD1-8 [Iris pallida]
MFPPPPEPLRFVLVSSTQSRKSKVNMVVILATSLLSGLVVLVTCVAYFLKKIKKRRKGGTNFSNEKSNESNEDLNIPLFEFGTIKAATNYFRDENVLGKGGFGSLQRNFT